GHFPILRERLAQVGGTLSGGEQQMLAIARALMSRPRILLLDEPSLGLAPLLVRKIYQILADVHREGTTILLVEQNAQIALGMADTGHVLEVGEVVLAGPATQLLESATVREADLGGWGLGARGARANAGTFRLGSRRVSTRVDSSATRRRPVAAGEVRLIRAPLSRLALL